jgi:Bacterial capsule synthesis protein PGA_cap
MSQPRNESLPDQHGERHPEDLSRRALMRMGFRAAAGAPLAVWLAACNQPPGKAARQLPTETVTTAPMVHSSRPDSRPITIAITGDLMLARSLTPQMLATQGGFPFAQTGDYLRSFDLTVGNLECVVSTLGLPIPGKQFTFEASPIGFERLQNAGFDVVSVANNHSGDYGQLAFIDMVYHLPGHGITPLGGGADLALAHAPVIRTVHTTTVGFLAYCEIAPNSFAATATTPGHAWLDPTLMRADIAALRSRVDFIIVFTHWGIEYQTLADADQQAMAHLAIDAGADLVVGAHPHVRQPSELYLGKPIIYSLGNFVFDEMPGYEESRGNVLELTLQGTHLLDWKLRGALIDGSGQPSWDD